jgi:hypothetical protein
VGNFEKELMALFIALAGREPDFVHGRLSSLPPFEKWLFVLGENKLLCFSMLIKILI